MKLKVNDEVKIVSGKDKGKMGKIEKVYPKKDKVMVSGVNQYKRHLKAQMQGQESQILTLTKPLPVENVMLICPKCGKETRIQYQVLKGKKERVCTKCTKTI